jgi:hypothetical protein
LIGRAKPVLVKFREAAWLSFPVRAMIGCFTAESFSALARITAAEAAKGELFKRCNILLDSHVMEDYTFW